MVIIAKALVTDQKNQILVLRRSGTHPRFAYQPDFPGGIVEDNETAQVGVVREIEEEVGLQFLPESMKLVYEKQPSDDRLYLLFTVQASEIQPEIHISWEHDQYTWLTRDELLNQPLPEHADRYYLAVLEYLRANVTV
jgi:mutator protein MutT